MPATSEAVEQAGVATGAPVRTGTGELCVSLMLGRESWALGEFLGRLHRILRACPVVGTWTPGDVLGHMTCSITTTHPPPARRMITRAVSAVGAYYDTAPPQVLYGDGPGIFSVNGRDISAIIDWGGVRAGSVADDIGCWTAHGATDRISLPAYTAAFLDGYRHSNDLPATDAAAVPLFQRLRIASRGCYVTDPDALASVQAWMQFAFAG